MWRRQAALALNGKRSTPAWWRGLAPASPYLKALRRPIPATRCLIGGISQYWTTLALSHAPAASVSPFNYTALIWGLIIGFVVWGNLPTPTMIVGAAIVTLTGLYLLHAESHRRRILQRTAE